MANSTLAAFEAQLDRAVEAAADAQAARDEARHRAGLSASPPAFFTAAEMISALCAADDRHRAEMREIVAAAITDCRIRWDRSYRPTALEAAMQKWPAAFRAALNAKEAKSDNVVALTAEQIISAGRRRRNEEGH
jgi:uncharacterized protein YecE (DUF72 family)